MSPSGFYLDPELSLEEQREMLEGFYEEIRSEPRGPGGQVVPHAGLGQGFLRCQHPRHLIAHLSMGPLQLSQGTVPGESQGMYVTVPRMGVQSLAHT